MFRFLKQYILDPKKTGAIATSSNRLAELITESANLPKAKTVVELGSGTGAFTEKILKKINENTIFFSIELNPYFAKETKKRCPDAIVYNDSAENLREYLLKHNATANSTDDYTYH